MNFKQMEAFRAVMKTRSMTAAAGLLHTSQPNISRWIALLEAAVGFTLFQRSGTKLIPTPEAEAFHEDVERAFIGLESLGESASSIRRRGTGTLRVGAVGSMTQCVIPEALLRFREAHPDIPVQIQMGRSDVVAKWTATGYCDIGYASLRTESPGLRFESINVAQGVAIVGRQHRLAGRAVLHPADFAGEPFISLPGGSINRLEIDRHFSDDARIPAIETPYAPTICTMVAKGLGVSIVSPVVSRILALPDLCEIPFSGEVPFHTYAVTSEHFPMSHLAKQFALCVRQVFESLAPPAAPRTRRGGAGRARRA
ncbi:LysR family transcriptional regulator [Bordetella genomosp. 5]|uniref:LysR substrate-binding domain-containing protein n=1 Tax=Bordetella genomosp. 5 TaxID=1395608 RepID=UPI000B9E420A|nr:LysR substrate-binding domain-containing protein [Bordetella genomosp. 5]OZI33440.1 LysR family transcriptional regulator [Bordetella genomosp. 5]